MRRRSVPRSPTRRWLRSVSCGAARRQGSRPGPPRRVQPPRPLLDRRGEVDQGRPLQAAQGHRQPDPQAAAQARRGRAHQQADVPRVPAARRAALPLPAPQAEAVKRLDAWLAWASRSRLKPFVKLARTIRQHKSGVLAAIELDISNGRLEALNSRVRLISHRAHGFHSADALIAMIYLCCAGIQIDLPHR